MPNWLRALIAGYGAKKLGGGCFSTILVFVIIYYALGQCNRSAPVQHATITPAHTVQMTAAVKNSKANSRLLSVARYR